MKSMHWLGLALCVALGACSDSSSNDSGVDATVDVRIDVPMQDAGECVNRCAAKTAMCGGTISIGIQVCTPICARGVTSEQLACMDTTPCEMLILAFTTGASVCGIGFGDGGSGG